jgi:hypothetical protein
METCQWFAQCTSPAQFQVEHPTLGWVDICAEHVVWLGETPSPTQFVPPLAANVLNRHPAARTLHDAYTRD